MLLLLLFIVRFEPFKLTWLLTLFWPHLKPLMFCPFFSHSIVFAIFISKFVLTLNETWPLNFAQKTVVFLQWVQESHSLRTFHKQMPYLLSNTPLDQILLGWIQVLILISVSIKLSTLNHLQLKSFSQMGEFSQLKSRKKNYLWSNHYQQLNHHHHTLHWTLQILATTMIPMAKTWEKKVQKKPSKKASILMMMCMKNKVQVQVQSHFGVSREVVAVEVAMEEAYVHCHFYLEAIQLDLLQVLRGIQSQKRVLVLSKILINILLQQGFQIHLGLTVIWNLHWIRVMDLMVVLGLILFLMFLLQIYLVWVQSSPTIETRARKSNIVY